MTVLAALLFLSPALAALADDPEPAFLGWGDGSWEGVADDAGPPAWTADGEALVHQRTPAGGLAELWVVGLDGEERRLTDGSFRAGQPDVGPEGEVLFVSDRSGANELWRVELDGTGLRRLTSDGSPKSFPVASPDGGLVAFVRSVDEARWRRDLCLLDLADGSQHTLYESQSGLGWPCWSPDGRWVWAYEIRPDGTNQLFRVAVDSGEVERVTRETDADRWCPDVSADGTRLAFIASLRSDGEWGANGELVVASLEAGGIAEGSERVLTATPWHENAVRFDPAGERLAYVSRATGYPELCVLELASGEERTLTRQPERELTRVARERGLEAARVHLEAEGRGTPLASESGLAVLLRPLDGDDLARARPLAAAAAAWYPESARAWTALERAEHAAGREAEARAARLHALALRPAALVADGPLPWARVLEAAPDPEVLRDAAACEAVRATGLPWRVVDERSGIELLLVPAGTTLLGAGPTDPHDRANERPAHEVTLTRPFYLGRYEVTNAEFRGFQPEHSSGAFYRDELVDLDADDQPVVDVSWRDAVAFCEAYDLRLPTEAEWEVAARAGVGTRYPWGDDPAEGEGWGNGFDADTKAAIPEMDWEAFPWSDGFPGSAPVGSFLANAWGFHDLFGNVWEWCRDTYVEDAYASRAGGARDPLVEGDGARVLRGGGFGNAPRGSGTPYRFGMGTDERFDANGFRVARWP